MPQIWYGGWDGNRGLGREEARAENGAAALPSGGGPLRGAASKEEEAEEGVRRCSCRTRLHLRRKMGQRLQGLSVIGRESVINGIE